MTLTELIRNAEARFISYKAMIAEFRDIEDTDFRQLLRDNKNEEEKWMKKLKEEKRHENEGMSPPYCYRYE